LFIKSVSALSLILVSVNLTMKSSCNFYDIYFCVYKKYSINESSLIGGWFDSNFNFRNYIDFPTCKRYYKIQRIYYVIPLSCYNTMYAEEGEIWEICYSL